MCLAAVTAAVAAVCGNGTAGRGRRTLGRDDAYRVQCLLVPMVGVECKFEAVGINDTRKSQSQEETDESYLRPGILALLLPPFLLALL